MGKACRSSVVLLLMALVLGGCGRPVDSEGASATAGSAATCDPSHFWEGLNFFTYDYDVARTPADLAAQADITVVGHIVGADEGQSYASSAEAKADFTTSVVRVRVDEVVRGDESLVHQDGAVYIEVLFPAFLGKQNGGAIDSPFDRESFESCVPQGRGIFFLEDRTGKAVASHTIDSGAGRPPGSPLTGAFVQGFLVEEGPLRSGMAPLGSMPERWRGLRSVADVLAALE